ncbi:hypothetical protein AMATHDRAFT_75181 [Amanita thiersii Skay4041]|uniref:Uncharacterized protein n=1 Tax=Amanita thiersii Skay4041 TaxID=703135 RepID=A0A2A9NS05_9AGAR|nr:hypothetical protein AMATHDRAFT_75181 [Amanita thiersii Skay4041]
MTVKLLINSVLGPPSEYNLYGVITEAFFLHKRPINRYTVFPQLFLKWNPNYPHNTHRTHPDFGIGGAEIKAAVEVMAGLPEAAIIEEDDHDVVQNIFHSCSFQAEDQAKAAVKGGLLPGGQELSWLMFVGPYFTRIRFHPFSISQLQTRSLRRINSGDFWESMVIESRSEVRYPIFLLGTEEGANEIEAFLIETSHLLL